MWKIECLKVEQRKLHIKNKIIRSVKDTIEKTVKLAGHLIRMNNNIQVIKDMQQKRKTIAAKGK